MKIKKLPEAELDIMLIIWDANEEITSDYLMAKLKGYKTWARTTVLNFLLRLVEKGFLTSRRYGKSNVYTSIITKEEYIKMESEGFFRKMHKGSVTSLVATLYDSKDITQDDLDELREFIERSST